MDYRNYCEINLGAIAHNYNYIKGKVGTAKVMGIVKADAYGHGILKVSETLINNGIDYLGVATFEEAIEIRKNFDIPIIILGFVPYNQIEEAITHNITLAVYCLKYAEEIAKVSDLLKKEAVIHIKIDTGMNRLGFLPGDIDQIILLKDFKYFNVEGIFTHFSCADSNQEYTKEQFQKFIGVYEKIKSYFDIKYTHCCNSAAIENYPQMHLNMVRPGISLYGLLNTNHDKYIPAMSFKSRIVHIKTIAKGSMISYNGKFQTPKETVVATIPVGYADGYFRKLSNNANVLINGEFAPVIGNICMDYFMADVTKLKAEMHNEVVLFGSQGNKSIKADELAEKLDTINYEVVCSIGKRVPRVYIK